MLSTSTSENILHFRSPMRTHSSSTLKLFIESVLWVKSMAK
nr:MAG TPA: hypothetical protein [Caudoviricetes sp.]